MTVQELIEELQNVEDKSQPIRVAIDIKECEQKADSIYMIEQKLYVNPRGKDCVLILNY